MIIETLRLKLIATTLAHIETELSVPEKLSELLDAEVPATWPPGEYDRPAMEFFRQELAKGEDRVGWYGWYAILKPTVTEPSILVGGGGYLGRPDVEGMVAIGYSIAPEFRAQGFATEMVNALVQRVLTRGDVKIITAQTHETNLGSIKVLQRCGFVRAGDGDEPGTLRFAR